MNNKEDNEKIMAIISTYLKQHPYVRFGQALCNLGIIEEFTKVTTTMDGVYLKECDGWKDDFYTESDEILERIKTKKTESEV
jgi:hypothetical protein